MANTQSIIEQALASAGTQSTGEASAPTVTPVQSQSLKANSDSGSNA